MARRDLLTDSERHALFNVPAAREDLARHYMLSSRDLAMVAVRRGDTNRIGFAVQLALMRHPGFGFTLEGGAPDHLVAFMGEQIDVSASAFDTYAVRPATASVHAREVGDALGLRGPTNADLPLLIEAGAKAAWSTDRGLPIVVGIMEALRVSGITLPSPSVIERAGIAGRARARQRTYEALLASLPAERLAKLDATLVVDPKTSLTPLAWLREIATAPTPDNVRGLLDRLACVRDIGLPVTIGDAIHADRLRQFVREGRASSAQLIGRYTPSRRRATLAAMILDLESRLTDAALDMADRIIGGSFTRGNNKQKRSYAETTRDVGRIMRLFDQTVAALAEAQESGTEGFAAVDAAVGWDKLLRARGQARRIADLTEENPLVRAADQWSRLRKFAPLLLEAIDFKAGRGSASTIAALNTLREMGAGERMFENVR
ncbi:Tn3 family transposase ISMex38 (plasmid) [Sphingobium sp. AntQ-1]|uniref:DUF4158 domain-containing protein n=1 Tax=Sphingobium sp. AntQ-1 TaxID=2930091 RepID=UPI00234E4E13|nr:DUF4158 domain-containing protein [Sphingobium sp. AntQ-1]WCP16274.1 Tn3 family transposase ISMex38 [Sphingobium sp. AntQ-1]